MEAIYSRELGIKVLENTNTAQTGDYKLSTALKLYHRLKGIGKSRLFFEVSTRSIRYLEEHLGHDNLFAVKPLDAGHFRDSLFERGLSSSSVKRVFFVSKGHRQPSNTGTWSGHRKHLQWYFHPR